jgi:hypothetical protein
MAPNPVPPPKLTPKTIPSSNAPIVKHPLPAPESGR